MTAEHRQQFLRASFEIGQLVFVAASFDIDIEFRNHGNNESHGSDLEECFNYQHMEVIWRLHDPKSLKSLMTAQRLSLREIVELGAHSITSKILKQFGISE